MKFYTIPTQAILEQTEHNSITLLDSIYKKSKTYIGNLKVDSF